MVPQEPITRIFSKATGDVRNVITYNSAGTRPKVMNVANDFSSGIVHLPSLDHALNLPCVPADDKGLAVIVPER